MVRSRTLIVALALGVGLAGVAFRVADAPLLAAYTGVFWGAGGGLTAHHAGEIPGLLRGDSDWDTTTRLWSGAFGGLTALAVSAMVGSRVADTADMWLVLGLFVIGVAVTMVNVGIGLALSLERSNA